MSDDQEKTEEPTSKRLSEARNKGQIARSKELNIFAMLVTSAILLKSFGGDIGRTLLNLMKKQFQLSRPELLNPDAPLIYLKQAAGEALLVLGPFMAVMIVVALIAPAVLGGWVFSWQALEPKFEKMDPLKGLARIFSINGWVELLKSLSYVVLILSVSIVLFKRFFNELLGLGLEPLEQSIAHSTFIIERSYLILGASLIVVVAIDVPYQIWHYNKELKMSRQEIKDEAKQSEGSPEIKHRVRRAQTEAAQRRMMADVPTADVIVTNPTHYAVALKYDQDVGGAPKVIAKGADLIAAQIRKVATEAKVPLVASPPLARALFYATEIDEQIPQGLYLAVAQVLAYVYQLKTARLYHSEMPLPPRDIPVPDEFKRDE
ncbi:MAG: flagellar biosynthesis protein FlhB [Methylococcaceae bacterium]|jgi:flagellar biosynthetic protein FlhB